MTTKLLHSEKDRCGLHVKKMEDGWYPKWNLDVDLKIEFPKSLIFFFELNPTKIEPGKISSILKIPGVRYAPRPLTELNVFERITVFSFVNELY